MSATAYVLPVESGETALSRRRRSTVRSMMTAGLDRDDVARPGAGATWGEASDKAQRLLLEERSAGVHPIDKYVGLNAVEKYVPQRVHSARPLLPRLSIRGRVDAVSAVIFLASSGTTFSARSPWPSLRSTGLSRSRR